MTTPETCTQSEFARRYGWKPSYVTALRKAGRLVMDGSQVRIAESIARIDATRDPSKAGVAARHAAAREVAGADVPAGGQGGAEAHTAPPAQHSHGNTADERIGSTYQASRAVRERFLALGAKRDYEISMGKLLEAAEVEGALVDAITALRDNLERLPDTLGPQMAAETDELRCRTTLADAIELALAELARQFRRITQPQGAPE